jgi:hypothetical protein
VRSAEGLSAQRESRLLPSLTDIGGFAATRGCTPCAAYAAIPAHPQKQYTRRWRLYHFCGFYYPIREVIPIAIYHWNIGIVSRGKGKSAVAAAAYRSGEKLTNEWDGMTHDYTRKGGVVHTEIMLPPHAPPSFSDRSTLWNSVELYEKAGNAQLASEIDAALPIELSREEQIRLVREYCSSQFVSRGMCVDFVIHDTNSGNPHCHIMLTMRPAFVGRRAQYNKFRYFLKKTSIPMELVGYIAASAQELAQISEGDAGEYLGSLEDLEMLIRRYHLDQIYILQKREEQLFSMQKYVDLCIDMGVTVRMVVDFYKRRRADSYVSCVGTYPVITYHTVTLNTGEQVIKRIMDVAGGLAGIVLFSPVMLLAITVT